MPPACTGVPDAVRCRQPAVAILICFMPVSYTHLAVYKVLENNKKQNEFINAMQEEQTLICYGLRGALQGLVEQGCNGPCKDALARLDKHLNKSAHPHIPEG